MCKKKPMPFLTIFYKLTLKRFIYLQLVCGSIFMCNNNEVFFQFNVYFVLQTQHIEILGFCWHSQTPCHVKVKNIDLRMGNQSCIIRHIIAICTNEKYYYYRTFQLTLSIKILYTLET